MICEDIDKITDSSNAVTSFAYNNRNLLASKTDPLSAVTTYAYDNVGRMNSRTDRKNHTVNYAYAADGKITTITYPDLSTVTFTYDALDRVTQMVDSLGTTSYAYDDVNRTITVTDANGFAVAHKYDSVGNLIELTYPGNKKVTYTYDQLNRLKTATNWLAQTATYNYDAAGRLISLTNFNGSVTTYGYDNANRLITLDNKKSDASVIATYAYTLNPIGNITQSVQDEPLAPVFTAETTNYTYNAQKTRLLTAGSDTFTYDNEGQLALGYGSNYTFDYEHRLSTISGAFNATYSYDGLGNRLKATRNGTTTKYVYDIDGNVIAEADNSNNILKYYVYGSGLMSLITPADVVYSYHFNNVGSTIAITDGTQNIVNKYAYDPFGVILNQVEAVSQPFKYVGQFGVTQEPNGFYKMGYRYYDPNGVFLSEDPIGFGGGDANLRRYVRNRPTMLIDPLGLADAPLIYGTPGTPTNPNAPNMGKLLEIALGYGRFRNSIREMNKEDEEMLSVQCEIMYREKKMVYVLIGKTSRRFVGLSYTSNVLADEDIHILPRVIKGLKGAPSVPGLGSICDEIKRCKEKIQ